MTKARQSEKTILSLVRKFGVLRLREAASVLTNSSGTGVAWRHYNAFGEIIEESGTWPVDLGYQTNWQTVKVGNKYWGLTTTRICDYVTRRFSQIDVIPNLAKMAVAGGNTLGAFDNSILASSKYVRLALNVYGYVSARPVRNTDPTGLFCCPIDITFQVKGPVAKPGKGAFGRQDDLHPAAAGSTETELLISRYHIDDLGIAATLNSKSYYKLNNYPSTRRL